MMRTVFAVKILIVAFISSEDCVAFLNQKGAV
jgi:hypothetical protein